MTKEHHGMPGLGSNYDRMVARDAYGWNHRMDPDPFEGFGKKVVKLKATETVSVTQTMPKVGSIDFNISVINQAEPEVIPTGIDPISEAITGERAWQDARS